MRVCVGARVLVHQRFVPLGRFTGVVTKHLGRKRWEVEREYPPLDGFKERVDRRDIVAVLSTEHQSAEQERK